ncbi:GIY-YIG nuclease family protein [Aeromonas rivipollensis]|uniref:GIY-YIG nuclease family protein n=1 Tax=Aeromonas rivipollensis TaxID=948519 RepID=UPI00259F3498|nr:GIY-YIG nuclease family protein [Aeromonas rivipollensis]MDM5121990.1 GIY-YIG nuclease family protein [Aeromonas rivipollensis]
MRKFSFNGKGYTTLSKLFNENKDIAVVGLATVRYRLKDGMTIEEALTTPKQTAVKTREANGFKQVVEGVEYHSLRQISDAYAVNYNTMYKRYERGCRGDSLLMPKEIKNYVEEEEVVKPEKKHSFKVEFEGVTYRNLNELCDAFGVKRVTYRSRLNKGYSKREALGIDPIEDGRRERRDKYEYQGKMMTLSEISEISGSSVSTIRDRLNRGATVEQAISKEVQRSLFKQRKSVNRRKAVNLEVGGVVYGSYKALAEAYDMPYHVVNSRITHYGWSPEDAVNPELGKGKPIQVNGIVYKTIVEAAEKFGISNTVILARLANGWTSEQAVGLELSPSDKNIEFEGSYYPSMKAIAENFGMGVSMLNSRVSQGMTIREAIDLGTDKVVNSGRYNETILRRDPELANSPAEIYLVSKVIDGVLYHKIGITKNNVSTRIDGSYDVIKTSNGTLFDCFILEQDIHKMIYDKQAPINGSDIIFGGYTEFFNLSEEEVTIVSELMSL